MPLGYDSMKLDLTGRQIEITEGIEEAVERKIAKLGKFFDENTIAHVTFSAKKEKQNVDIRIEYKSKTYMAEVETTDIYHGLDDVVEKLIGQIRKEKTKMEKARRNGIDKEEKPEEIEE